jgi:hypothetical protein
VSYEAFSGAGKVMQKFLLYPAAIARGVHVTVAALPLRAPERCMREECCYDAIKRPG